jgi:hypothetical protein
LKYELKIIKISSVDSKSEENGTEVRIVEDILHVKNIEIPPKRALNTKLSSSFVHIENIEVYI